MILPLELPFMMTISGGQATMSGVTEIDRWAYAMGQSYPDAASVGFIVKVRAEATATRQP